MKLSSNTHSIEAIAPAKLILTGEHAVLYHCPALSLAIQLYTRCLSHFNPSSPFNLKIELADFGENLEFNAQQFEQTATAIEDRYQQFKNQKIGINEVLKTPTDLVVCALDLFNKQYPLNVGSWEFCFTSEIPLGRGLGSSASVITSLLKNLQAQMQLDITNEQLLALAKQIESRQHGKSSGLDPATILQGGVIKYKLEHAIKKVDCQEFNAWLIDTGEPLSSTGQAVMQVQQHTNRDHLWQAFKAVSENIEQALQNENATELAANISANQRLLEQIGVVPEKVKNFIMELEQNYQAAAKVCGSGAVIGEQAGVVLCLSQTPPSQLCQQYGFGLQIVTIDTLGANTKNKIKPNNGIVDEIK